MASNFSLSAVLFLLATSALMVASDECKELIGACSNDCNTKCESAHKGFGFCQPGTGGQMGCWCHYDCPPLQTCEDNFKLDGGCNDLKCDIACAAKYPGKGAQGICIFDDRKQDFMCHCQYYCNPPSN